MECVLFLLFILKVVAAGVSPIYSPSYSMVSYAGAAEPKSNHPDGRLKGDVPKLTVLGKNPGDAKTTDEVYPTSDTLIPNEITLEPESEQIDFVSIPKRNGRIELSEDTGDIDGQTVANQSPSTEEGVYYVYHPNGLLQKVVFATRNDPGNGQYTANLNYKNVEPIVEPIFTYDPNTFVFQRLQLG